MNIQFKKGVLELIVLVSVSEKDMYGYELIALVSEIIDINEGSIYPLLKRMTNEKYFDTYLAESNEGPPRKYYKITNLGKERMVDLVEAWKTFSTSVNAFIEGSNINE